MLFSILRYLKNNIVVMKYVFIVFQLQQLCGKSSDSPLFIQYTYIDLTQFVICLSSMQEASGFIGTRYHPTLIQNKIPEM